MSAYLIKQQVAFFLYCSLAGGVVLDYIADCGKQNGIGFATYYGYYFWKLFPLALISVISLRMDVHMLRILTFNVF